MDPIYAMRLIPDRTPDEIVRYIYAHAVNYHHSAVAWLEIVESRVIMRVWFFRNYSVRGRYETRYTECVRKISGDKRIIYRNGYWTYNGASETFQPVYQQKDVKRWYYGYEDIKFQEEKFNIWNEAKVDLFAWCIPILNLNALSETKYKYCAYPCNCDLMTYLAIYEQDNSVEFFGKCGLYPYPSFVKLAKKDKTVYRFLRDNAAEIDLYGPEAGMYAFKHKVDVAEARRLCEEKRRIDRVIREDIPEAKGTHIDRKRLYEYIEKLRDKTQRRGIEYFASSYNDYLKAVKALGLDLNDTKNIYPRDFNRMHDLRIDEYTALEAEQDRVKRKQLYDDFSKKAQELKRLEWSADGYSVIIPDDISDLKREGNILHHCVGKMGYDVKVIKGTSIIGFLRKAEDKDKPLYTLEYRIDLNKIAQCYGKNDTVPAQEIRDLAEKWGNFVKTNMMKGLKNGKRNSGKTKQRAGA